MTAPRSRQYVHGAAMGRNSQNRRARRTRGTQDRPIREHAHGPRQHAPPSPTVTDLWVRAVSFPDLDPHVALHLAEPLAKAPEGEVDRVGQSLLLGCLAQAWEHGWQPEETVRQVRRRCTARAVRLVELAVHADDDRRTGQRRHPSWVEQLHRLGQRDASVRGAWLSTWRRREQIDRRDCYALLAQVAHCVGSLPPVDVLIHPPGAGATTETTGARSHPVLDRVRKLLAKAESSEFEEEASALTAKAQQLMTRHAIDEAMLTEGRPDEGPRTARIPVDAPYADAKSVLLEAVAQAGRCRAVALIGLDVAVVVGHDSDLLGVQLLFTSLLVQAQQALAQAARSALPGTQVRSTAYRSSFLLSFARRIGERLEAANAAAVEESPSGAGSLPVLRTRAAAVDDLVTERWGGRLTSTPIRGGHDGAGWQHGRTAADSAALGRDELT